MVLPQTETISIFHHAKPQILYCVYCFFLVLSQSKPCEFSKSKNFHSVILNLLRVKVCNDIKHPLKYFCLGYYYFTKSNKIIYKLNFVIHYS